MAMSCNHKIPAADLLPAQTHLSAFGFRLNFWHPLMSGGAMNMTCQRVPKRFGDLSKPRCRYRNNPENASRSPLLLREDAVTMTSPIPEPNMHLASMATEGHPVTPVSHIERA